MWIDDSGRPHVMEDELVMEGEDYWDFNISKLLEFVQGMGEGWADGAIVRMLQRGVDDLSLGTPWVCALSVPHVGAIRGASEVE